MHRAVSAHDARLGHRYLPSLRVRVPHERGCYWVHTNRAGFRCEHELDAPRRPDRPRILLVGDSFAAGDGVDEHERWSDLLAASHGLEVHNLALPGTAAEQHALVIEDHAPQLAPDQVWIALAVHTIARIGQPYRLTADRFGTPVRRARPWGALTENGYELRGLPVPEPDELLGPRGAAPLDNDRTRARCTPLRGSLERLVQRLLGAEVDPDYADPRSERWLLLERLLARCTLQAQPAPIVVIPVPTAAYVAHGLSPRYRRRFSALDAPACGRHVLDVTEPLVRARLGDDYTFRRDGHPSPRGHAALAAALSGALLARGLVPPRAARAAGPSRPARPARAATLELQWAQGGAAVVRANERVLASAQERAVGPATYCEGALPYAAIGACLEAAELHGPDLAGVELVSPLDLAAALVHADSPACLAPYVRWFGAAERDIRRLLAYDGPVTHRSAGRQDQPLELGDSPEARWLGRHLHRLLRQPSSDARRRRFERIARRWEARTRQSRWSVVP